MNRLLRFLCAAWLLSSFVQAAALRTQADLGVRVAEGFHVERATAPLSPDKYSPLGKRVGPDGWSYLIEHGLAESSLVRVAPDGKTRQTIANGFRNAQGFDFNTVGDIFIFDGDRAADFFLPWYVPSRLFHVGIGQDHGSRGKWTKPDYYADLVDILVPVGRASADGLVCYRHTQFPEEYRDGLFFCDSEFGRVYFCKLQRLGSTYRARLDLFLEATGFAPTEIVVAPDGSLLIGSTATTYRVEHTEGARRGRGIADRTKLQELLQAPQPLELWSRAQWQRIARELGPELIGRAINNLTLPEAERIRAIEIHVEVFGALPEAVLETGAQTKSTAVRARIAWALGRQVSAKNTLLLRRLAIDTDAMTRRFALEAMLTAQDQFDPTSFLPLLRQNLDHPVKRLRQSAARFCAALGEADWERLWDAEEAHSVQTELSLLVAAAWHGEPREEIAWRALETLPLARERYLRHQALRALQLGIGDWNLTANLELHAGYESTSAPNAEWSTNALADLQSIFPTGDPVADAEIGRLLAMLADDSSETVVKVSRFFEGLVSPTTEFHFLTVLSRLRGEWSEPVLNKVAETIRNLESKLRGPELSAKQNWILRRDELVQELKNKEPRLAPALDQAGP